ncbi:MAG TPA: hypothetical protein ACFYEH_04020 [Candidatus Brocadiaceae bacterium]|nr:MAG: hypothetical protein A2Y09_01915 [Planctomycetes bacterium GWA2_39_15]
MSYLEWNNRLAKYFFNEEMAGREVLLYVDKKTINTVGEGLGDVDSFLQHVKNGPPWVTRQGLCQKALQAYEGRRERGLDYPPYIAYLALFVLAGDTEGEFSPHAYYPRLRSLLGDVVETGQLPSFNRMIELWDDLEKWSKEDKNEELGRFTARVRGNWIHIGLPLSQMLLSHDEREKLYVIFNQAELDPTDIPAVDTIKRKMLYYGNQGHLLEKRTLKLLEANDSENMVLKNALLEFVLDELAEWDGTVPEIQHEDKEFPKEAKTGLRICLNIDNVSNRVKSYLRFKTNKSIPDTGLNFQGSDYSGILTCFETNANWSSPLKDQAASQRLDASSIDWLRGFYMKDPENNWHTKLKGSSVRLFVSGKREVLPDWIESHHLERKCEFMIAAHSSMIETVRNWGSEFCEKFQDKFYNGLPAGWILFYGKNATKSCDGVEVLALSDLLRMRLQGGIKTGRGNTYLKFGLPFVSLENISGNEKIKINGVEIKRDDENVLRWELRGEYPLYEPLQIQVFTDSSESFQTRIIKIEAPRIQSEFDDIPCRGPGGNVVDAKVSVCYVIGAKVTGIDKRETNVFSTALPTHLSSRIIFIGSRPGEIRDWPTEDLPDEWQPVWAIVKDTHKRWDIYFCGSPEHLDDKHVPGSPLADRRTVKRWKEAVWVNRKINQPPALPHLSSIWKKYKEAVKNA